MVTFNITDSSAVLMDGNDTTTALFSSSLPPSSEGTYYAEYEDNDDYPLTNEAETLTARILPRITAFVSLLGVICVAMEALGDVRGSLWKKNNNINAAAAINSTRQINNDTVSHIQLFYQVGLFCYCLAFVLGSTPAPSNQPIWGAYGNQATCTAQGALFQFGMYASIGWDIALSTTYWTMTRRSGSSMRNANGGPSGGGGNDNQHKRPWKLLWHAFIWPIALGASIYPLAATDLYNFNTNLCWINQYPNGCQLPENPHECVRGGDGNVNLWTNLASFAAIVHLMYSTIVMIALYCSIRKIESALEERRRRHAQQLHQSTAMTVATTRTNAASVTSTTTVGTRQYSRKIAIQGMLYASGMIVTMLPTAIMVLLANFVGYKGDQLASFALTMVPLTGYINFFIYLRNRSSEQCHTRYAIFLRKLHCNFEWWNGCNKICCWFPRVLMWLCFCLCLRNPDNVDGDDDLDPDGHPRKSSSGKSNSSRLGGIQLLTLPQVSGGSSHNNNKNDKNNKQLRAISQLTCSIEEDGFTSQYSAAFDYDEDDPGIADITSTLPIDLDQPRQPGNILDQPDSNNNNDNNTADTNKGKGPKPPPPLPAHFSHSEPETEQQQLQHESPLVEQHPHESNRDRDEEGGEQDPLLQQQPSVPGSTSSADNKNHNNKKGASSKTTSTGPFKMWVSEASDFETWRSEADEAVVVAAAAAPPRHPPTTTSKKNNNNNHSSTSNFKVWKSELSEFETWQSQLEENPNKP